MTRRWSLLTAALAALFAGPVSAAPVLLEAARIRTLDDAVPEARAMLYDDETGAVLAVAHDPRELAARRPQARRLDLRHRHVVPGLIDAHGHLLGLGQSLLSADLVGARSKAEVVERLRRFEQGLPRDAWLLGRGWDQNDWPEQAFPTAADLDDAFPDRPVWLERVDGHAGWANTAALRRVERKLDGDFQPDGGRIERADGRPTGVFVDSAMALVERAIPAPSPELIERALERAFAHAVALGLTGVHDMGVSRGTLAVMQRMADAGRVPLRISAYADGDAQALEALCRDGLYTHRSGRLSMRGVKLYADGALGSRGAALLADYSDDPGNRGLLVTAPPALEAAIAKAKRCGVQVATHAIGDRGNRLVLDAYARALGERGDAARRWRIEHAQIVAPGDIARFATLGVIASMQPTHATSDMPWAQARVGAARIVGGYAWRAFRDAGVHLAFGSDFPVESTDPRLGLRAAITRQDADGQPEGGWYAAQRVTAHEALRAFTRDAAWASFDEDRVGRLAAGMRADFVVLDGDLVDAPDPSKLKVLATYVDGRAVHDAAR